MPVVPAQPGRVRAAAEPRGGGRLRRLAGLIRKESLQMMRDPSSFLIAGVLPLLLLFIFGFGVTLDLRRVPIAVVVEWPSPEADSFLASFRNSRYFEVRFARHRQAVEHDLVSGRLKGVVVLAADFSDRLGRGETAPIQVLVDGSDPNTAGLVQTYVQGLWSNWLDQEAASRDTLVDRPTAAPPVATEPRTWFNPELDSQYALLPGAVAIVLTLIGTLLTSLVVAREWERGTMEALLATPITPGELLGGQDRALLRAGNDRDGAVGGRHRLWLRCAVSGLALALLAISSAYLAVMLALGLLISTLAKNQFAASQGALIAGFLPAFELSGLHLRDRQHARADPPVGVGPAAALFRLEHANALPGRRRAERARAQRAGAHGDGGGVVRGTRAGDPGAPGVNPCGCGFAR